MSAGNSWNSKPDQKDQVWLITLHDIVRGDSPDCCCCTSACVSLSLCPATEPGVTFDPICPFNLSTAVTVQAWKVRGVNVQHSWAILRASHQVSFRCYISPLFTVAYCWVLYRAYGSWKTTIVALVVSLAFLKGKWSHYKTLKITLMYHQISQHRYLQWYNINYEVITDTLLVHVRVIAVIVVGLLPVLFRL